MKQVSDKYSIAWFKLAECVARGEKERALGVYRLLSHSFEDHAFARQLGADLLRAFDDQQALTEYDNAAQLYEKNNNHLSAAAIYEHLIVIDPQKDDYVYKCLEIYQALEMHESIIRLVKRFILMRLEPGSSDRIHEMLEKYSQSIDIFLAVDIYETVLFWLISIKSDQYDIKKKYLSKIIDGLNKKKAEESISRLIKKIELMDSTLLGENSKKE